MHCKITLKLIKKFNPTLIAHTVFFYFLPCLQEHSYVHVLFANKLLIFHLTRSVNTFHTIPSQDLILRQVNVSPKLFLSFILMLSSHVRLYLSVPFHSGFFDNVFTPMHGGMYVILLLCFF
jgi:hypothetical protein